MYDNSLSHLLIQAEAGDAKAQYQLGIKYYQGKEVEKNIETALLWLQQAEVQGVMEAQPFIVKIQAEYEQLSIAELSMRAATGDAQAQYQFGLRYYIGQEVTKDIVVALEWLEQALEQGVLAAQRFIADIAQERDYAQLSISQILTKAENGDAYAQYLLGIKYYQGEEIDRNIETALLWFQQAEDQDILETQPFIAKIEREYQQLSSTELFTKAENGDAQAQYLLGLKYYEGDKVNKDISLALEWLEQAVDQGVVEARDLVAKIQAEPLTNLLVRAAKGEAKAKYNLGLEYYEGNKVKQDIQMALEWLAQAQRQGVIEAQNLSVTICRERDYALLSLSQLLTKAESGDAYAQYLFGLKYYQAQGVEKNIETALLWFQQAEAQDVLIAQPFITKIHEEYEQLSFAELSMRANAGEAQAQYLFGLRYYAGEEITKDITIALEWLEQALDQGVIAAQNVIAKISQERDYEQLSLYQLLAKAEAGDAHAQYLSGLKYYHGEGFNKDIGVALLWFQQAEVQGILDAQAFIAKIQEEYEQLPLAELSLMAEKGECQAQYLLGLRYYEGKGIGAEMCRIDVQTALKWLEQAMDQGVVAAKNLITKIQQELTSLFIRAANGEAKAQYILGLKYYEGDEVKKNIQTALEWLEKAAAKGAIEAQSALTKIQKDYEQLSPATLLMKVKEGDAQAQYTLGFKYYTAQNLKSYKQFSQYDLLIMAENGDVTAQYLLGLRYYEGNGVKKDILSALKWLERAEEQGVPEAQKLLTNIYQERKYEISWKRKNKHYQDLNDKKLASDKQLPLYDLLKKAENGNAQSQYLLGLKHYEGHDVYKNIQTALKWFKQAAAGGVVEAQSFIAKIQNKSKPLTVQKPTTALLNKIIQPRVFTRTNYEREVTTEYEQGHNQRLFDIEIDKSLRRERETFPLKGNIFVEFRDKTDMQKYYEHRFQLGMRLYQKAQFAEAKSYFLEAAHQGNTKAQFQLAHMYMNGEGMPKNIREANRWLDQARNN